MNKNNRVDAVNNLIKLGLLDIKASSALLELENIIITGNVLKKRKGFEFIQKKQLVKDALRLDIDRYKHIYNLSQDEIDEIMKEMEQHTSLKETAEQLSLFEGYDGNVTLPSIDPQPFGYVDQDSYKQFKQKTCDHDWKIYQGLNHTDTYCTKCNEIKK